MTTKGKKAIGCLLIALGLALCGVGGWLLFSPAQYRAVARIETVFNQSEIERDLKTHSEEIGLKNEYIFNESVLSNVVIKLNLCTKWGRLSACANNDQISLVVQLLKKQLDLKSNPPNDKLLITGDSEIGVITHNPNLSAAIANTIAETFRDYNREYRKQKTLDRIKAVEAVLEKVANELRKEGKEVPAPIVTNFEDFNQNYENYARTAENFEGQARYYRMLQVKSEWDKLLIEHPLVWPIIVELAHPPKVPIEPNRRLGGALLALGLGLFAIGLRLSTRATSSPAPC